MAAAPGAPPPAYPDSKKQQYSKGSKQKEQQGKVSTQPYARMDNYAGAAYQPTIMPMTPLYNQQAEQGGYTSGPPMAKYGAGAAGQPPYVVVGQPGIMQNGQNIVYVGAPSQDPRLKPIDDLFGLSIFTTLCCNLVFGIIAVMYSARVREAKRNNDFDAATHARSVTLALNVTGIAMTAIFIIVCVSIFLIPLFLTPFGKRSEPAEE